MEQKEIDVNPSRSATTAIIAGIIIIALGYLSYRYFNRPTKPEIGEGIKIERATPTPEPTVTPTEEKDSTKEVTKVEEKETVQERKIESIFAAWVANDYKPGDIKGSQYNVRSGDTLWEIAEGRYGNGSEWTKILSANSSKIGFLPNGSQALIFPSQTLALP
ncbi:hypothetical protein A2716_03245 [candidate division WWE3 bacterium RIFCSPHIGHO2_01_FULL_40_23]|uniref:LysM domain-containing protein n=1 Tax=candidate division WWE3 bacterium RIFCSPLOWO2_01_FULL_41_18 TaxID=1802625 RepID=A0A1F4VCZ3_UNCKA|nr:MAG: hypothetical protein A2716_03245 [candidate division WWE3 bacterium RIFCSPHIGHO2_01_FULL_40_23]OGC54898.1 MAG: hypothetical protein A3A78_02855 [candidate division WWE3 bacterium RIFCSPLOWO2_01_FULL_41_18]